MRFLTACRSPSLHEDTYMYAWQEKHAAMYITSPMYHSMSATETRRMTCMYIRATCRLRTNAEHPPQRQFLRTSNPSPHESPVVRCALAHIHTFRPEYATAHSASPRRIPSRERTYRIPRVILPPRATTSVPWRSVEAHLTSFPHPATDQATRNGRSKYVPWYGLRAPFVIIMTGSYLGRRHILIRERTPIIA